MTRRSVHLFAIVDGEHGPAVLATTSGNVAGNLPDGNLVQMAKRANDGRGIHLASLD